VHQTKIHIQSLHQAPSGSLLNQQLNGIGLGHSDFFYCDIDLAAKIGAQHLLALTLYAFVNHPPVGVGRLMQFRNVLVKPLGLRTATLGCPVSSLAGKADAALFDSRFPVLAQLHTDDYAQVVLGADDKHLKFRSCAAVQKIQGSVWQISLGTRVHYNNWFCQFYMGAIDAVHRNYVAPTMLKTAVEELIKTLKMKS
jgi:hypothetical protein